MNNEPLAPYLVCVWIGGFFYWILKGFSGKYVDQLSDELRSRNFWTGYFISMGLVVVIIYFAYNFIAA